MEFIKDPALGQYFIQIDEYNYSVFKTIMPDSGKPYDSLVGHFSTMEGVLKKIAENKVRQKSYGSIKEYLTEYRSIVSELTNIL